ncbi:MAG: hypothetical protein ABIL09_29445 [Gemmatimonadota bacterium]
MNARQTCQSILFLATLLLAFAAGAAEQTSQIRRTGDGWTETIDQTIDVGTGGTLVLSTDRGGVQVDAWDGKGVRVLATKHADVYTEEEARRVLEDYRVQVDRKGADVHVTARAESRRSPRSLDVNLKVLVPRPYGADVRTDGGGISIGDLEGDVTAETGGGGIDVGRIRHGSVKVTSAGGGIRIAGIEDGDGRAETSGGGITVGDVTGKLEVYTSGGGITVGKVGGELVVETSGGGIEISGAGGRVQASTGGGGIEIKGARGPVSAHTGGGGVRVQGSGGLVEVTTGGGGLALEDLGGPVKATTGGGGITIRDARGYIEATTGGGGVTASLAVSDPAADTHCNLESGGGDLVITLPGDLQATVDAEVRLQNPKRQYEITSDFTLETAGDPDRSERLTARGTLNGGGDLIRLRTTNGDIQIRKR